MWSMKEMFYGSAEPVWIMKPEKKDAEKAEKKESGGKKESAKEEYSILSSVPYYPYYYPDYVAPSTKKNEADTSTKKETKVLMRIPICCGQCEERIYSALQEMKGVKSVDCNYNQEKVTVVVTTAAPADVLMECRKVFRKSRMWSDDD